MSTHTRETLSRTLAELGLDPSALPDATTLALLDSLSSDQHRLGAMPVLQSMRYEISVCCTLPGGKKRRLAYNGKRFDQLPGRFEERGEAIIVIPLQDGTCPIEQTRVRVMQLLGVAALKKFARAGEAVDRYYVCPKEPGVVRRVTVIRISACMRSEDYKRDAQYDLRNDHEPAATCLFRWEDDTGNL